MLLVGVALLLLAAPVADAKKKKKNKVKKLKQAWQVEVLTSFYKKYDPEKTKSEVKDVITTRKVRTVANLAVVAAWVLALMRFGCRLLPSQDKGYHDGLTDPEWNRLDEKIKDKYKKTSPMEHWRAQGGREWAPLEKNKMSLESDQEFLKRLTVRKQSCPYPRPLPPPLPRRAPRRACVADDRTTSIYTPSAGVRRPADEAHPDGGGPAQEGGRRGRGARL